MVSRYIKKILEADVYDVAEQTPLDPAPLLSDRLGSPVYLKREDLQPVFSFKIRGAYNKIKKLDAASRKKGVITASAGNHAQGVALAATRLGIKSFIVMGKNTPSIKVNAVARLGGHVILHGENYDEAAAWARKLVGEKGYTYVHPFDDPEVIAGQGTIGMEILRQHNGPLSAVFAPVGGGGLIGGVGSYIKYLRPEVKIIGVEAEGSASMWAALDAGRRVKLSADALDLFADGTAVAQVGKEGFAIARKVVDEVIKVSIDEICAAIKDIFEDTRSIAEPSGALAVAGMKKYRQREGALSGPSVAIVSGANINFDRLRHIAERTEIGERREMLLGVTIPEKVGSFRRFCSAIGKRAITEFNYRYADSGGAHVLVGIQTSSDPTDREGLLSRIGERYELVDLSDNEIAVLHVRHMVGGRAAGLSDERLFRFEFPERPGALLRFLTVLGTRFNISMFHYRNHGSAYGRVLVGIQVPDTELARFRAGLARIGYRCWEESDNPAYRLFLGPIA
ncbi:MAG: threonine ammonia-lyase, biosynthetic [Pseudomonadales bacterium]|nr:threonine ammonia-lyase, biosynthetic [Pseudomonadales bacterium]